MEAYLPYKYISVNTNRKQNTCPYNFIHVLYSLFIQNHKTYRDVLYITHEENGIKYKCSYDDFIDFLLKKADYNDLIDKDIIIYGNDWIIQYNSLNLWDFTFISDQFIIVE
jgi:hypothetical protein